MGTAVRLPVQAPVVGVKEPAQCTSRRSQKDQHWHVQEFPPVVLMLGSRMWNPPHERRARRETEERGVLSHTAPIYRRLSAQLVQARREVGFPGLIDTVREGHVQPTCRKWACSCGRCQPGLVPPGQDRGVEGRGHRRDSWADLLLRWPPERGIAQGWNTASSPVPIERVELREVRVWLTADQAQPVDGVSYNQVPTTPLPLGSEALDDDRWRWKVQRTWPQGDGPARSSCMSGTVPRRRPRFRRLTCSRRWRCCGRRPGRCRARSAGPPWRWTLR